MKNIFLFLLLCCLTEVSMAQFAKIAGPRDAGKKVVIDNSNLKVTYRVRISTDTLDNDYYYDNQVLEIGNKYNRYYSAFAENMDSVTWKVKHNAENKKVNGSYSRTINLNYDEYGSYEDIFINYPELNKVTVYNSYYKKTYAYKEPIPSFDWNITERKDTVLGYSCIEATTNFRGRDYRVWFTLDIPINYGPWKLRGLPGLILKAEDTKGLYKFTAIGIEQSKDTNIYLYDLDAIKCKRKDILKLNDLRWKDFMLLSKANGMLSGTVSRLNLETGKIERNSSISIIVDYIPQMELE